MSHFVNTAPKAEAPAVSRSGLWAILKTLYEPVIDLVFPAICSGCGKVGMVYCHTCQEALRTKYPLVSQAPTPALLAVVALGPFEAGLRHALHSLKYEHCPMLAAPLGKLMAERIREVRWPHAVIIPVPLHAERLAQRGYNQAVLLAEHAANELGWKVLADVLIRDRATISQVGLGYHERQENVRDAFRVTRPENILDADVILVDDVYTTGATLNACAQALLSSGARSVRATTAAMTIGGTQG